PQEGDAVGLHRRKGADDQRENDAAEDEQDRDRAGAGDPVECGVTELESIERLGTIESSGGFHYLALNGHVCHADFPLVSFSAAIVASSESDLRTIWPRSCSRRAGRRAGIQPYAERGRGEFQTCLSRLPVRIAAGRRSILRSALDIRRPGLVDQLDH